MRIFTIFFASILFFGAPDTSATAQRMPNPAPKKKPAAAPQKTATAKAKQTRTEKPAPPKSKSSKPSAPVKTKTTKPENSRTTKNSAAQPKKTVTQSVEKPAKKPVAPKKTTLKTAAETAEIQPDEKTQAAFDAAKNTVDPAERIKLLNEFIAAFPRSALKIQAEELLVTSYAELGEFYFRQGDAATGTANFRAAAAAFAPAMSDRVFNDFVAKFPFNLFFRNERAAALEIAAEIEPKVNDNAARLLTLANFYLSTENADAAKRLANRASEIAPASDAAQMTLGMAHRINFQLEAASSAYARAVEIAPANAAAKRSLADALRGLGQAEDAVKIYRELVAQNVADEAARTGLILALFNAGQREEAERELADALTANPKNLLLQTGAAYFYATAGEGKRAVELAQKAVELEPRYVWAQIALARGLILERRPLEAERALLNARQFGNFPTLDYELANARFAAGLYDEARDDLQRSFALKNNKLGTRLAGRMTAEAENFLELLSRERRSSIFQPVAAADENEVNRLKQLLIFANALDETKDETALAKAAADFAAGTDEMRVHRELYAATKLLNRKTALPQVLELAQSAAADLDKSLDVSAPTAAVLAEELYEPRRAAVTRGTFLNIPDVSREVLSRVMRGRIEELAGWTLFQQDKRAESIVRLKRAVGILPEKSAWWRSSLWKLGSALEADGKPGLALDAYVKSYKADVPSETKLTVIAALYERINGSRDGLEQFLNNDTAANNAPRPPVKPAPTPARFRNPLPDVIAEVLPKPAAPQPAPSPTPAQPQPEIKVEPTPEIKAEPTPENKIENAPENKIEPATETRVESTPEVKTEPTPESVPEVKSEPPPAPPQRENAPEIKPAPPEVEPSAPTVETPATVKRAENNTDTSEDEAPPSVKPADAKPEPTPAPTIESTPEKQTEIASPQPSTEPAAPVASEIKAPVLSETDGGSRPRVIIRPLNGAEKSEETAPLREATAVCTMSVNQKQLSVIRNGGTASVLITFENAERAADLKATVSSPNDVEVKRENDSENRNQVLFEIRSISEITKLFTITFESPCGKQEVLVRVR